MSAFIIPFPNNPAILELQSWLKTQFPEATEWINPAAYHVTLVQSDADMTAVGMQVANIPAFGIAGMDIDWLVTPDNVALVLRVSKTPQLIHLQASVFYAAMAGGITTSAFSWPGVWRPHITLAYLPREGWEERWVSSPTQVYLSVDRFILTGADYAEQAAYSLSAEVEADIVAEMSPVREMMKWQFSGTAPDVPIASDVDLKALKGDDDDPFFVTLPAFPIGKVSANGRLITRELGDSLIKQINNEKPGGIMGHLRDEDRSTQFPIPEVYWVGAAIHNDVGWVKGYVPPGQVREMLRNMKRVKSAVALSIYGPSDHTWDKTHGAWVLSNMELESIDLAPPKRSGYGMAVVPTITAEMQQGQPKTKQENPPMDKLEIIREMTADDAKLLPDPLIKAIVAAHPATALVAEMRQELGLDDKGDLAAVVREMKTRLATIEGQAIEAAIASEITAQILPDAKGDADGVRAVREMATSLVKAAKPATVDAVKGAVAAVAAQESIKTLAATVVVAEMGPKQPSRVGNGAATPKPNKFFDIPEDK